AWPIGVLAAALVAFVALLAGASPRVALQVSLFVSVVAVAVGGAISRFAPRHGLRSAAVVWALGLVFLVAPLGALLRGISLARTGLATVVVLAAVTGGLILFRGRSSLRSGLGAAVVVGVL